MSEYTALYSHADPRGHCLEFVSGDVIKINREYCSPHWWYGEKSDGSRGYFLPSTVTSQTIEEILADPDLDLDQNEEFFGSYSTLKLQHEMLSDQPRTNGYHVAINKNKGAFEGKVVLDVGCGTGILSLMAARAGAKKVYAVEASEMANFATRVVERNGYSDVIQIINSRVEEAEIPEKVDIIISEWMGTLLIFEAMIESVLWARKAHLTEDGIMFPSTAKIFFVPVSAAKLRQSQFEFFDNPYGFDMTPLGEENKRLLCSKPKHDHEILPDDMLSQPMEFVDWDMKVLNPEDFEELTRDIDFEINQTAEFSGMGFWFDVGFRADGPENEVVLSTGPGAPLTHWKQGLLMFEEVIKLERGDRLRGSITVRRNKIWRRHYNITVILEPSDKIEKGLKRMFLMWR